MTTEEQSGIQKASQANGLNSNANDANKDNKGAQESESQDNAVEDDCIIGLDIDDWEDDEKEKDRRRSWDRTRGKEKRASREREKDRERDRDRDYNRGRRRSRSRGRRSRSRGGRRSRSNGRRSRSNERRREPSRRDPNKSSKDIEQDKLRAKKDNDSKILAEKEKAIKTLLDSDNVLPPGTETEAIQTIVEKNQQEQEIRNQEDKTRTSRKRSPIYNRLGPKKHSKSPIRLSPLRREIRRSPFSPSRVVRRRSNERDSSIERRLASRRRLREREGRLGRRSRSRSRDRHRSRSRSFERRRSRSTERGRRLNSRSPFERRLSRRSRSRSPNRSRRRSPFINELARQFSHDGMLVDKPMGPGAMPGAYGAVPPMDPHRLGPNLLSTPGMPGPSMMNPMHPGVVATQIIPAGPGIMPVPRGPPPPFLGYDAPAAPGPFDPMNRHPAPVVDFPGPAMFGQGMMNPVPQHPIRPVSPVPQPVPAPVMGQAPYAATLGRPVQHQKSKAVGGSRDKYSPDAAYGVRHSGSPNDKFRNRTMREERMKTPEPPIISDSVTSKPVEKASLSSLLEASVSAKDVSSNSTTSSKGIRPEIMKHCERALRSLPAEDPRLKLKGRFFFDPVKKNEAKDKPSAGSNSILLRKGRTEIHWDDEEKDQEQTPSGSSSLIVSSSLQSLINIRRAITHPKYCQTEETPRGSMETQTEEIVTPKADFSQQVGPADLMPPADEPKHAPALAKEENRRVPMMEDVRRPMEENRQAVEVMRRSGMEEIRRPVMEDMRRPNMEEIRRPNVEDMRRPNVEDMRRAGIEDMRRPGIEDMRRPGIEDMRRPGIEDMRRPGIEDMRRPGIEDSTRRPVDRLDWSMRETFDHGADRVHETEDLRWNLSNSSGSGVGVPVGGPARPNDRSTWSRGFSPKPIDHMHGNASMDSYMRNEREMDTHDRDMDVRMDMRMLDLMRERERLRGAGSGNSLNRPAMMEDYTTRRQPVADEYDFRKHFIGGGGGGPGSIDSFNRAMEMMERDEEHGGASPIPEDPDDELEIIEERAPWQPPPRNNVPAAPAQFGNARGGNVNRSFRGRLGGFRNY